MYKFMTKKDDIFNSRCRALINPVNCEGISGKGLALEFKKLYPNNFEFYKRYCKENTFKIGDILMYKELENDRTILNFPTKNKWKEKSKIEYIILGLDTLLNNILLNSNYNITSLAIPALGCGLGGLGGLDYKVFLNLLEGYILNNKELICDIEIYPPK